MVALLNSQRGCVLSFYVLPFAPLHIELAFDIRQPPFMTANFQLIADVRGQIDQYARDKSRHKSTEQNHALRLRKGP